MTLRLSKVASVGKGASEHGALPVKSEVTKPNMICIIRTRCFRAVMGGTPCVCPSYKQGQYAVRIRFSSVCCSWCGVQAGHTKFERCVLLGLCYHVPLPSARASVRVKRYACAVGKLKRRLS